MRKIILIFLIILTCTKTSLSQDFPESSEIEPKFTDEKPIEAGIEKTIEVSLDDCIRLALGNNPKIQSAMQDVFASNSRLKQTWSAFFPQFSWNSGYSRIRQLQLSDALRENLVYNYWVLGQVSLSQMLYDFGVTQNQATIRRLDYQGYKIILTGTINEVIYNVKDAYYNLQYAIEAKKIAEKTVVQYQEFYNQAKAFYNAGMNPKVDVTISQVNLSNAKLSLIQANQAVNLAMAKLNNTIGIPYSTKYNLSEKLLYNPTDITLNKTIELAQSSRPEFQLADIKEEQSKQNLKLVKKSWFPWVSVEGQIEVGGRHPDSNYGYTLGGYINFPTINGMLIKHEIREARSLYSKQKSETLNTKNNIYLEVQNAYYTLEEKKNKIPVANLGVEQARENYELSSGRYQAGVGNPVELNNAQLEYENSELTYYKTLYEYNSARANLEKAVGVVIN